MLVLPIHIYQQEHSDCAVAAVSSLLNYYDKKKDYKYVSKFAEKVEKKYKKAGLDAGAIGLLLNNVGFKKVTIYTSDTDVFDYAHCKGTKREIVSFLNKAKKYVNKKEDKKYINNYIYFLKSKGYRNKVVVDYDFPRYIKENIDKYNPVILSINWTKLYFDSKYKNEDIDPFEGDLSYHEVIVMGYDKEKVCIGDSNMNKKRSRYIDCLDKGIYTIKWEYLMLAMNLCDLHVAENYELV